MPKVAPQKGIPEYYIKQSPTDMMPKAPFRMLTVGPGSSGKTVALSAMILDRDKFRGVFSRIYVWSPSIRVDDAWGPVKDYVHRELGHDETKEPPAFYETFDPADMQRIVRRQQKITETLKKTYADKNFRGQKRLFQVLFLIDDMADQHQVVKRAGGQLDACYVRYRHFGISTLISTQALKLISTCIRKNLTAALFFKMRNASELHLGLIEEFSQLVDKETLMKLYKYATDYAPYQFLYVNFLAPVDHMFYRSFEARLVPQQKMGNEPNEPDSQEAPV